MKLVANIQLKPTKEQARALRATRGYEARFRKHTNHLVCKEIVANAERSLCALGLEDAYPQEDEG